MSNNKQSIFQIIWNLMPFRYILDFINLDIDILYKGGNNEEGKNT